MNIKLIYIIANPKLKIVFFRQIVIQQLLCAEFPRFLNQKNANSIYDSQRLFCSWFQMLSPLINLTWMTCIIPNDIFCVSALI